MVVLKNKPIYKCVLETFGFNLWTEANLATQIMLLEFLALAEFRLTDDG